MEKVCEAVAAERAGWTERTAGQQPADTLKKFSVGGRKPSSKPRVKPMKSAERRRHNQQETTIQTLRAMGNWQRGESGGGKAGAAVPSRLEMQFAISSLHSINRAGVLLHTRDIIVRKTPQILTLVLGGPAVFLAVFGGDFANDPSRISRNQSVRRNIPDDH